MSRDSLRVKFNKRKQSQRRSTHCTSSSSSLKILFTKLKDPLPSLLFMCGDAGNTAEYQCLPFVVLPNATYDLIDPIIRCARPVFSSIAGYAVFWAEGGLSIILTSNDDSLLTGLRIVWIVAK